MDFAARYGQSLTATNLMDDSKHFQCEPLAAMALSSRLGTLLYRAKYNNDGSQYARLLEHWTTIVERKAAVQAWPASSPPAKVAERSLAHWLFDRCPVCTGRGFETLPMNPRVLSDRACPQCHGTGRKPMQIHSQFHVHVSQCVSALDDLMQQATMHASIKLSPRVTLPE